MAGAESQVMSLWQVSDPGTRELMTGVLHGAEGGPAGRSAALREMQLEMLRTAEAQPSLLLGELHPVGRRRADRVSVTR